MILIISGLKYLSGAGEMGSVVKALGALPDDSGLISSTTWHLTTLCDSNLRESYALF